MQKWGLMIRSDPGIFNLRKYHEVGAKGGMQRSDCKKGLIDLGMPYPQFFSAGEVAVSETLKLRRIDLYR